MNYLVIRGEYPFDEVVDMLSAVSAEAALAASIKKNKTSNDVFMRHPVVEPMGDSEYLHYKEQ